jgi:hypothetical protein
MTPQMPGKYHQKKAPTCTPASMAAQLLRIVRSVLLNPQNVIGSAFANTASCLAAANIAL